MDWRRQHPAPLGGGRVSLQEGTSSLGPFAASAPAACPRRKTQPWLKETPREDLPSKLVTPQVVPGVAVDWGRWHGPGAGARGPSHPRPSA